LEAIGAPKTIVEQQPKEKFALGWGPRGPDHLRRRGERSTLEEQTIGQGRRVDAVCRENPPYGVRRAWTQYESLHETPKIDELGEQCGWEILAQVSNPTVVEDRGRDGFVLPS
jgi:hypothetical protein